MKRREFIKLSVTASALGLLPHEVGAALKLANTSLNCNISNRKLVLIELKGGNDGLNTLIPYDNYGYYSNTLRPDIHIPVTNYNNMAVDISKTGTNQDLIFNPALLEGSINSGFKGLYQDGMLRVLQSVGYPSANKSHFASIDLWATGNDGNSWDNGKESGWMGRFIEKAYSDLFPSTFPVGIQLGSSNTWLGFHGEHEHGTALNIEGQNSENFYTVLNGLAGQAPQNIPSNSHYGTELQYIVDTDASANIYAEAIQNSFNAPGATNLVAYPDTDLADQLKTVARLIRGGIETKVYMVTIGGFDTHNNQNQGSGDINGKHTELLTELSSAVDAFVADINSDSVGDDIIGLTFSEFGRKAIQNGNYGTDHGEIAPMFVFGKPVQGGISGVNVDLNEANSNNNWQIKTVQHDYRQVFATIMQDFLGADNSIIDNAFFDNTNMESFSENKLSSIIKTSHFVDSSCYITLGTNQIKEESFFAAYPNPVNDKLFINPLSESATIMGYRMIDTNGRTVKKGKLDFENGFDVIEMSYLKSGIYIVQLSDGERTAHKKIIKGTS
ncbi:MAG: DUF1501 domain-containing protein [Flavobacteriaceae bacterium]|jgi:uncharacterized protein (DUF1501 family)|nr:hypothetical protein [Flavobacteriaceae bacterium]|tara:strand:+ start:19 stop:1686 length:1668 start_codon:yes stop_codon:yes gene_type:complete